MLEALLGIGKTIADSLFPSPKDAAQREAAVIAFNKAILDNQAALEAAMMKNIQTEATSSHWLAANWRPLIMVVFAAILVMRWFGFEPPNMTQEEILEVYGLIKMGIGGYGALRSVEKVVPTLPAIAAAFRK